MARNVGGDSGLLARVRDIGSLGVEDEEMTKEDLAHIARLMYDVQEHCAFNFWEIEKPCKECAANKNGACDLFVPCHGIPKMWGITKADIERLEKEANLEKGIAAIDELAESPEEKIL